MSLIRVVLIIIIKDITKVVKNIEGFINIDLSIISNSIIYFNTLRVLIIVTAREKRPHSRSIMSIRNLEYKAKERRERIE